MTSVPWRWFRAERFKVPPWIPYACLRGWDPNDGLAAWVAAHTINGVFYAGG